MDHYFKNSQKLWRMDGRREILCVTNYQQILASIEPIYAVEVELDTSDDSNIRSTMSSFLLHLKPSHEGNGYLRFELDEKESYDFVNRYSSLTVSVSSTTLAKQLLSGCSDDNTVANVNNNGMCTIQLAKFEIVENEPKIMNAAEVVRNLARLVFSDLRCKAPREVEEREINGDDLLRFLYFVAKRIALRQSTSSGDEMEEMMEDWNEKVYHQTLNTLSHWHSLFLFETIRRQHQHTLSVGLNE